MPRYWPSRSPVHCSGTFNVAPPGRTTWATTVASFFSTKDLSTTRASICTGSPGSTRSVIRTSTTSGTPSTIQRISWRQNCSCVWSSSGIEACICHSQESWAVKAMALPRPKLCEASTIWLRPRWSVPVRSAVAPGLSGSGALTLVTCGSWAQRATDAACVRHDLRGGVPLAGLAWAPPSAATAAPDPTARVFGSICSGSASATGVPP